MKLGRFQKMMFLICVSVAIMSSMVQGVNVATQDLWNAVQNGDPGGVRDAIENHADVNAKDDVGLTALHKAAVSGSVSAMAALLKMGADKESQNNCSDRPLHLAAAKGNTEAVTLLIVAGADSKALGCLKISPKLLADRTGRTITAELIQALQYSHNPVNSTAVEEVNSALFAAVGRNDPSSARDALEAGADVEAVQSNGEKPLYTAAREDKFKVMGVLIKAGANVNARDDKNNTALHAAIRKGSLSSVALLAVAGADLHIPGEDGRTPLMLAYHKWRGSSIVELLRAIGGWSIRK